MDVKSIVNEVCKKYRTENVFDLAEALNINVYYHDLSPLRGYYYCEHRIKNIVIDSSLPRHIKKFVLGHEIGHSIMHPNCNTPFLQNTLLSTNKLEIQANKFAIQMIMTDLDIMEHWEYTIDEWAMFYKSWRKAPAFRHGDISHTLLPRKEILRGLH